MQENVLKECQGVIECRLLSESMTEKRLTQSIGQLLLSVRGIALYSSATHDPVLMPR